MRARSFVILERAVEEGFRMGWARAHKHTDKPGEDVVEEHAVRAILDAIEEVFAFDADDVGAGAS